MGEYRDCLRAILEIAPTNRSPLLEAATVHLNLVGKAVPWALSDWTSYHPALDRLSDAARLLRSHSRIPIPGQGVRDYPVLAALRRHSLRAPRYDDHARALLISLAIRLPTEQADSVQEASNRQAKYPCITVLSRRIRGLNREDSRTRRGPWFDDAAQAADSAQEYLLALTEACRSAADPDVELHDALAISAMRAFGLPTLPPLREKRPITPGPKTPLPPSPPSEPETDEEDPLPDRVEVCDIAIPIKDPDDGSPEAQDEARQTLQLVRRKRPTRKPLGFVGYRALIRGQMRAQNISSAGESFLTRHVDVLSPDECGLVAKTILEEATESLKNNQQGNVVRYSLLALMLSTGLTADRVAALLRRDQGSEPPYLGGDRLLLQSMLPESAFQPQSSAQPLVPVGSSFSVDLPPSLAKILRTIRSWVVCQARDLDLQENLSENIRTIREKTGIHHVSKGRIRRAYAALIHDKQQDYCATATLAQDRFGLSPAPLHYYSVQSDVLANLYRQAIWPIFGDSPDPAVTERPTRIGTRALPKPEALRTASRIASRPLHAGIDCHDPTSIAKTHNALSAHIASMLMSVVGHRHSNALFRLRRWDFDLELGAANIADKVSDPAHMRRLVGLGEQVSRQIVIYLLHLDEARQLPGMEAFRRRAEAALKGKDDLFFRLDEKQAEPLDADLVWLKDQLGNLPEIPTNAGRHYLGSNAREWTENASLVAIQLGHYESVGYPWTPDSPMIPSQFIQSINPVLDKIFLEQGRGERESRNQQHERAAERRGWRLQSGLASTRPEIRTRWPADQEESWTRTGPLVDWHQANLEFAREAKKRNLVVRRNRWFRQHQIRHETQQTVVAIASSHDSRLADLIAYWVNDREKTRRKQDAQFVTLPGVGIRHLDRPPEPLAQADQSVESLFAELGEQFPDREAAMLAHNTVASALIWAHRQDLYRGPLHTPWLPLRPVDLSPFTPGLFRACSQVRLLRKRLDQIGRKKPSERGPAKTVSAGITALALAIDGGVDDPELLEELIAGDCVIYPVPAVPDAIVVHCRKFSHACGLRGIAAIAYLNWHKMARNLEEISSLEQSLERILPKESRTARTNLARALCSTVSMHNRIHRSGMSNFALDLESGCTSLDEDQLARLVGADCQIPRTDSAPNSQASQKNGPEVPSDNDTSRTLSEEYNQLLHLHHPSKDVLLPLTGLTWRYDHSNTGPERSKLVEEARLAANNPGWSWFGRYWARWIERELTRPKLTNPKELLAYSSVFGPYSEAARRMRDLLMRRSSQNLENPPTAEFLEHLYELILDDSPVSTQRRICKTLLSFHHYVAEETGIDDIDPSNYWEFWRPSRQERGMVRTRIPYTEELDAIEAALVRYAETDSPLDELGNIDRRGIREALIAFRLTRDSGARIAEIAGLRTVDTILFGDRTGLIIRPNRRRALKTRASRRLVDISDQLRSEIREFLIEHVKAERSGRSKRAQDQAWLFADYDGRPIPTEEHRNIIDQVALEVIGRPLRWHALRHRYVCVQLCLFLLGLDLDKLSAPQSKLLQPALRTPREAAAIRAQVGHARLRTTLESYFHLPWMLQLSEYAVPQVRAGELASALGINQSAAYGRIANCGKRLADIAAEEIARVLGTSKPPTTRVESSPHVYISSPQRVPRLCLAVHALGQGAEEEKILYNPGLTRGEIDQLRAADLNLAMQTGIGIARDNPHAAVRYSRPPKWPASSRQLQELWVRLELRHDPHLREVLSIWQTNAHRGLRHGLACRRDPRSRIFWPIDRIQLLENEMHAYALQVRILESSSTMAAVQLQDSAERNVTSEAVWALAICHLVQQTTKGMGSLD
jgi:site-specific recombinase XerD